MEQDVLAQERVARLTAELELRARRRLACDRVPLGHVPGDQVAGELARSDGAIALVIVVVVVVVVAVVVVVLVVDVTVCRRVVIVVVPGFWSR
jgi:hypothetical protein